MNLFFRKIVDAMSPILFHLLCLRPALLIKFGFSLNDAQHARQNQQRMQIIRVRIETAAHFNEIFLNHILVLWIHIEVLQSQHR